MSNVHEIVLRNEAYDRVGSDFAEGPGFVGAGAGEDVVLAVVEDVAGLGFGDSRGGFGQGWVEGDEGVEFDAVGLEDLLVVCSFVWYFLDFRFNEKGRVLAYFATGVQCDESQSRTTGFDSANCICQQLIVDSLQLLEVLSMACVGGIVDVRDLLDSWNVLKLQERFLAIEKVDL